VKQSIRYVGTWIVKLAIVTMLFMAIARVSGVFGVQISFAFVMSQLAVIVLLDD